MSARAGAYNRLNAGVLFVVLLVSDWLVLSNRLLRVRHALLAAVALTALPYAARRGRDLLRDLQTTPVAYFAAFLALGLVLAPFARSPVSAVVHALVFAGVTLFALAASATVPLATTLAALRVALAIKLATSLALGLMGPRAGSLGGELSAGSLAERHDFGGVLGNPNPLCTAAAIYLLLAGCHLVEQRARWPRGWRGGLCAAWYAATIPVAAYLMWRSLSRSAWVAVALAALFLVPLGVLRRRGGAFPGQHRWWLFAGAAVAATAATLALLVWLNIVRGVAKPGGTVGESVWQAVTSGTVLDAAERPVFWQLAATKIRERPWTGYGVGEAPALLAPLAGLPREHHAHNLELEAALYAGLPGALLIALFAATTVKVAAEAVMRRRPLGLSAAAALFFYVLLAQVEPAILGAPYPSLLIVLVLAAHVARPDD